MMRLAITSKLFIARLGCASSYMSLQVLVRKLDKPTPCAAGTVTATRTSYTRG